MSVNVHDFENLAHNIITMLSKGKFLVTSCLMNPIFVKNLFTYQTSLTAGFNDAFNDKPPRLRALP